MCLICFPLQFCLYSLTQTRKKRPQKLKHKFKHNRKLAYNSIKVNFTSVDFVFAYMFATSKVPIQISSQTISDSFDLKIEHMWLHNISEPAALF